MNNENIEYTSFYLGNPIDGTNRRVVAAYTTERHEDGSLTREVAFATCNPVDNFNRARGQRIARGRLDAGNTVTIFSDSNRGKRIQDAVTGDQFTSADESMFDAYRTVLLRRMQATSPGSQIEDFETRVDRLNDLRTNYLA